MDNVDLFLKALLLPDLDGDDSQLGKSVYSDECINKASATDDVPDPVRAFFKMAADAQISKISADDWNEELGGAVFEKRDKPAYKTMADLLGIVRTEKKLIDGQMWVQAFNAADEMVDTRVIYG